MSCVAVTSISSYSNSAADAFATLSSTATVDVANSGLAYTPSATPPLDCSNQFGLYLWTGNAAAATASTWACIKCSNAGSSTTNWYVAGWCNYYTSLTAYTAVATALSA